MIAAAPRLNDHARDRFASKQQSNSYQLRTHKNYQFERQMLLVSRITFLRVSCVLSLA